MSNIPSSLLDHQRRFLTELIAQISTDNRFMGLALSGSAAENKVDRFSDLDLVIAVVPSQVELVMQQREAIAANLGTLVACATGEHVGEPRLLICLFDTVEPLHVDLKFVSIEDAHQRVDNPLILWEIDNCLSHIYEQGEGHYPIHSPQWFEDRFWIWMHYGVTKVARGELYEALDFVSFIRQTVIGPLGMFNSGFEPNGLRKIEFKLPKLSQKLVKTVAQNDKKSLFVALETLAEIYISLRQAHIEQLELKDAAQQLAMTYLYKEASTKKLRSELKK
ncbi:aminoglycoside 6-adenylyltransferase [Aliiglaciecola sp. 3_MG-2023]|uniref:aminoglycoside 6-adenylyltransferase n=1 Tax=Aliiglaciecola sp. 3_MG-2023 TaxID=3062644 RepID=UPI0026E280DE|nr:aminoglycoside 6-adenylyltransferase [Aliiglaciecola sp. 3_MG-2023]MDO6695176.1 aminoglycoside 6-adenylyltransferase [Aliiglaciecola sp. 3_MG-2023]